MSYGKALEEIPVVGVPLQRGRRLALARSWVQLGTLAVAVIIPLSGLFRIDPQAGAFVVLDRQIWFSDFFLVTGLWLALSSALVMTYSLVGTAFCGWMCPQNTFSEWANRMTRKFLGRRAEVSLEGEAVQVSPAKRKWRNWAALGAVFLIASMALALIPLLYFYPPEVVWSFVSFRDDARLAGSLYWIYTVFVLIVFLDITLIRHFWCRFMCIYRVWQHSFKTKQTLHIVHDKSQPNECARCNYCVSSCIVAIDPRNTETYDSCINCGACISACAQVRAGRKTGGSLLRFAIGERSRDAWHKLRSNVGDFTRRVSWAVPLTVLGGAMFVWGLISYEPYHFSVYREDTASTGTIEGYRVSLANKLYRPATVSVRVEGLGPEAYKLSRQTISLPAVGRGDTHIRISRNLRPGLYTFVVHAEAPGGWQDDFLVRHYVPRSGA